MGGDRDVATCRCSTCSTRTRAGHAVASRRCWPTSSRRRARSSASWPSCARSGPPAHALDAATTGWPRARALGARATQRAADALERRGDLVGALRAARHWTSRRHPRRAAAAGHRRRRAAAAGDRDRRRTARASAPGTAASGCPSARTRRGWTSCSRRPACTSPASTGPTCSARPAPRRCAARPGSLLVPLDRAGDRPRLARERLPVARRLPRHAPADAARATASGPTTARRTTRSAARARARAHARDFVARVAGRRGRRLRHRALRPLLARGRHVPGGGARAGATSCRSTVDGARAAPPTSPPTSWGAGARPAHLERAAADGLAWTPARRRAAPRSAPTRRRARCASCSRCRAPTGRS